MSLLSERPITAWAPVIGRWETEGPSARYIEPQPGTKFPFGICVSNVALAEGFFRVVVVLAPGSAGRILLGYRSPDQWYLSVGLGGHGSAYVFSEYEPSFGWRALAVAGAEDSLVAGRSYTLEVQIIGQRIHVLVDSVRVLEHVLSRPLPSGQAGLYTWGSTEVAFQNATVSARRAKVFVVMPFTDPYKQLHDEVIKPVAAEFDLEAYNVGEVFGPGLILDDISQGIIEAKIVIAEVTSPNENVFYELGYAHALGKPTILLAERGKKLPFDIAPYRCVYYDNTIAGKAQVEDTLRRHFEAIVHEWGTPRMVVRHEEPR